MRFYFLEPSHFSHGYFKPKESNLVSLSDMVDLRAALSDHVDVVFELFEKFSAKLRGGFAPAVVKFIGFFHAIDWKVSLSPSPKKYPKTLNYINRLQA